MYTAGRYADDGMGWGWDDWDDWDDWDGDGMGMGWRGTDLLQLAV